MSKEVTFESYRPAFSRKFGVNRRAYENSLEEGRTARELARFSHLQGTVLPAHTPEAEETIRVIKRTSRKPHTYPLYQSARVVIEDADLGVIWQAQRKIVETTPAPTVRIIMVEPGYYGKEPPLIIKRDLGSVLAELAAH